MSAPSPARAAVIEFEDVFTAYVAFVWRALARLGVEPADVQDHCQEVFIVVHRRLSDFDPQRSTVRTWVYGICLRVASQYRRRRPTHHAVSDDAFLNAGVAAQQSQELERREAWQRLAEVLSEMDTVKSQAFVLYELEELSMREIALVQQCPLQTAYARLHAARRLVLAAFRERGAK